MPVSPSKDSYFPAKPKDAEGFKEPVSWLGGRELISSLKGILVYSIYGENIDPRSWMKANIYPTVKENAQEQIDQPTLADQKFSVQSQKAAGQNEKLNRSVNDFWLKKVTEAWEWKKKYFLFWRDRLGGQTPGIGEDAAGQTELKEFWFDYIADSGDGQRGVYGVGCLCLADLWLTEEDSDQQVKFYPDDPGSNELLPRGSFLFVGGDTAYHVADFSTIHERFQTPFRWAFASVRKLLAAKYDLDAGVVPQTNSKGFGIGRDQNGLIVQAGERWDEWDGMLAEQEKFWDTEPPRPLFGVPANHDYYDDIDGFNRQFRRPPFENLQENEIDTRYKGGFPLAIPSFQREQEASYTALRLPFDWWFLGIDSENEKLDFRQRIFFDQVMKNYQPKKLILATPEPTTVFGIKSGEQAKTAVYLGEITKPIGLEQPFLKNGELLPQSSETVTPPVVGGAYCRLDLSGDVHHYARYWGPDTSDFRRAEFASENYASLVAGGGGAFFDSTETLIGTATVNQGGQTVMARGEIPPQTVFPLRRTSREATADRIFDLWNIRKGGYVQIAGAVIAVILFYSLAFAPPVHSFFAQIKFLSVAAKAFGLYAGLYLFLSFTLILTGGISLHNLINKLKRVRSGNSDETVTGKISELRVPFFCLLVGTGIYFLLFYWLQVVVRKVFDENFISFGQSLLLLLHLLIAVAIIRLSVEYANWLPLRFKFFSTSKSVDDGWTNLFVDERETRKIERAVERRNNVLTRIWLWYRRKSVENIPIFILNGLSVVIVILGIRLFGSQPLWEAGLNILFTLVALGCFLGLIAFAVSTGAAYQKRKGKFGFGLIGVVHAVFQILTPFVLVYYGNYWFVLGVFVLTVVTNGSVVNRLTQGYVPQLGAWLMKRANAPLLLATWTIYGLLVIVLPLLLPKQAGLDDFAVSEIYRYTGYASETLSMLVSLVIVGYLGYRMSRVWFSWYLAVSLAFNGHNNEAGGAARIEDFKHILRIKVEPEKLTVYVIGFDKAQTELTDLEPRLVDRFELKCKTFPSPNGGG